MAQYIMTQKEANSLIRAYELLDAAHFALLLNGNSNFYMNLRGEISGLQMIIAQRVPKEYAEAYYESRAKKFKEEENED